MTNKHAFAGKTALLIKTALVLLGAFGTPTTAQPARAPAPDSTAALAPTTSDSLSYADVADLFLDAPLVLTVRVTDQAQVPVAGATAAARLYLQGDLIRLIRGRQALATRVAWIADVPLDARGRVPKLKKSLVVLAALPVAGRPGEVRLAARDAMQPWSEAFEARVRAVVAAGLAVDAPPAVAGVASAFHVAGNLPGEGETQIFLTTARAQPVSLTVLTRPGEPRRWAVALGEIVDEAAAPPPRDSLGWYRLACFLPAALPAAASKDLATADAAAAQGDYRFVIDALGSCTRTRGQR